MEVAIAMSLQDVVVEVGEAPATQEPEPKQQPEPEPESEADAASSDSDRASIPSSPPPTFETETFSVGPIWGGYEAQAKADAWLEANKPGEGWEFTGQWWSNGGTSFCACRRVVGADGGAGLDAEQQEKRRLVDFGLGVRRSLSVLADQCDGGELKLAVDFLQRLLERSISALDMKIDRRKSEFKYKLGRFSNASSVLAALGLTILDQPSDFFQMAAEPPEGWREVALEELKALLSQHATKKNRALSSAAAASKPSPPRGDGSQPLARAGSAASVGDVEEGFALTRASTAPLPTPASGTHPQQLRRAGSATSGTTDLEVQPLVSLRDPAKENDRVKGADTPAQTTEAPVPRRLLPSRLPAPAPSTLPPPSPSDGGAGGLVRQLTSAREALASSLDAVVNLSRAQSVKEEFLCPICFCPEVTPPILCTPSHTYC